MFTSKEGLNRMLMMNTHQCTKCGAIFVNFKGMKEHMDKFGHLSYNLIKRTRWEIHKTPKKKSEHYKNNPNDRELTPFEKNLMSKFAKMRHRLKISNIKKVIHIRLLKTQMRIDTRFRKMFIEMFPNEYNEVLKAVMDKYGLAKKMEIRKKEIIKDMNFRNINISKLMK